MCSMVTITLTENEKESFGFCTRQMIERFNPDSDYAVSACGKTVADFMALTNYNFFKIASNEAIFLNNLPVTFAYDVVFSAVLSAALGYLFKLGEPYNFYEQSSKIFQTLAPVKDAPKNSNASADDFGAHSDDAAIPISGRVEHIMLLPVCNIAEAQTGIVTAQKIFLSMPRKFRKKAQSNDFLVRLPASFGFEQWSEPCSLFQCRGADTFVSCPTYATKPADPEDQEAIGVIEYLKTADEQMEWVTLSAGNALIFCNHRNLHARKQISEGHHRAIIRSYWMKDLSFLKKAASTDAWNLYRAKNLLC